MYVIILSPDYRAVVRFSNPGWEYSKMESQNFLALISIDVSMKYIIMYAINKFRLNFGCYLIFDIFLHFFKL